MVLVDVYQDKLYMLKTNTSIRLCYTSLAIGNEYNKHAQQLAKDIHELSPNIPFVILTDRPKIFDDEQHVIAIKHKVQSVGIFHDKLYCIEKSLETHDCCIFIDSDCRLIENFAMSRKWKPGITAKTCWSLTKHIAPNVISSSKKDLKQRLIYEVTKKFAIPIEQCKFIYEGVFIVHKDNGKEVEFLKIWKQIRDYFEVNGIFDGEGVAMGLAAYKASLPVLHYRSSYPEAGVNSSTNNQGIYKDKLFYRLLIHNDKTNLSDVVCQKVLMFDKQRKQVSQLTLWRKIVKKISNLIMKNLRLIKLNIKLRYHN